MDGFLQASCVAHPLSDIYSPTFSPATFLSLCESLRRHESRRTCGHRRLPEAVRNQYHARSRGRPPRHGNVLNSVDARRRAVTCLRSELSPLVCNESSSQGRCADYRAGSSDSNAEVQDEFKDQRFHDRSCLNGYWERRSVAVPSGRRGNKDERHQVDQDPQADQGRGYERNKTNARG